MKTDHPTRRAVLLTVAASAAAAALPAAARARTHTIVMEKMRFGPSPAGVRVGDTIVWINRDLFRHTATARDRSFDIDLAPGASGRTVMRRAGSLPYICRFHPGMTGRLTVSA
ncbi:cupredoxin domain-containing protein [Brevundimonas sp.]|uniref:cupredoxin domain-containing protein n=1 Tax=Brevundimonas sp. TaxID=1871086 RepID=UPI002BA13A06|nr:cupredoxin domain-containing protein [Brevundimonas sp.]HWQ86394.1 cupredoxin domain-containing protein [Brevundimonas sp.]